MTRLSVNINKIATIRNARGGNRPDVTQAAVDCERFGAQGITVHPRPDERHIRYSDVRAIRPLLHTELNIEGNPTRRFVALVVEVRPAQVTLVPDSEEQITSDHGWDTRTHAAFLTDIIGTFKEAGVRTSLFVDADPAMVEGAKVCGADRVELYTEPYAARYATDRAEAVMPFVAAAEEARRLSLGLNAGHDLSLTNLYYYIKTIPWTEEVSIGHALICDALYIGLKETIRKYLECISQAGGQER